jgi:protocatechuate 3,4-dioxygenase beta subunit
VSGVIVDRAGRPVPSAEIVASTSTLSASSRAALTDANGGFRVGPFEPGAIALDVRAAGFVTTAERCETSAPCRVMLSEGATLRGRVLDEAHEPIADAWVEVVGEATDRAPIAVSATVLPLAPLVFSPSAAPTDSALPALPPAPSADEMPGLGVADQVPPIPLAPGDTPEIALVSTGSGGAPPANAPATIVRTSLRTNADGEFVVSGLPPGRVEVIARAPGHRAARSPRLQLAGGRSREGLELVLGAGGHVHGRVLDEHGRPADARIEARIENDPIPRYLSTDARGEFRVEDVGGTVLLFAMSEGRPTSEQLVDVRGGQTEDVAITLDAGRRTLRARVLDPHGDPVEDALVRIESLTAGTGQPRTLVSDGNGEIELTAAPPGAVSLEASHPGHVSAPVIAREDGLVTLTLAEPVTIATTLLDAWTGAAVADAEITWTCLDETPCHRSTASDTNGVVDLPRARPGRYRVEVRASGYAPFARELTIRAPRRGDLVEVEPFVVEPGLRVSGDVVDRFGRPVEAAEISVDASDVRDALVARTDERGHFEITGVPAGRRTLSIVHASAGEAEQSLDVRRDRDPAPIVIHLPERFDDDGTHGDRARRVVGVGIEIEASGSTVRVSRVVGAAARRAGLVPGDVVVAVDGRAVASVDEARVRLLGSSLVPALLEVRRGETTFFVRTPHELH